MTRTVSVAVTVLALVAGLVVVSRGSAGDTSHEFRLCLAQCARDNCSGQSGALPFSLSLLGWSCYENCDYQCMHRVTAEDVRRGRPVRQFHGKWPFLRLWGVQEPASVLFSLGNAATVAVGYQHFSSHCPEGYPLRRPLNLQLVVSLNTWLWSTVFHARDMGWTEKLDYFSAALLIVSGLVVQFIRLSGEGAVMRHWAYGGVWLCLYLMHVAYLSLGRFDYGYNMAACVAAGMLYAGVWTVWSVKEWRQRRYVWKCVAAVMYGSCMVLLELMDFPPLLWAVDAHALWHLSTIPIPLLWYSFLTDDANYEAMHRRKTV